MRSECGIRQLSCLLVCQEQNKFEFQVLPKQNKFELQVLPKQNKFELQVLPKQNKFELQVLPKQNKAQRCFCRNWCDGGQTVYKTRHTSVEKVCKALWINLSTVCYRLTRRLAKPLSTSFHDYYQRLVALSTDFRDTTTTTVLLINKT
jgi:hypothetical protein